MNSEDFTPNLAQFILASSKKCSTSFYRAITLWQNIEHIFYSSVTCREPYCYLNMGKFMTCELLYSLLIFRYNGIELKVDCNRFICIFSVLGYPRNQGSSWELQNMGPKPTNQTNLSLSCVRLLATPWTGAYQAPLSMVFSRQQYWSGLPFPSPVGPKCLSN